MEKNDHQIISDRQMHGYRENGTEGETNRESEERDGGYRERERDTARKSRERNSFSAS